MASSPGQFQSDNDETALLVALIATPILIGLLWHFVGRHVYVGERILLYGILSAWGSFPTDWPLLGWLTRQFLFFRYVNPKDIAFVDEAVPDSLIVNIVFVAILALLVVKRVLYISQYHPYNIFGRRTNLYDYVEQQMPLYPHLRVMWKLKLLGRPLREGLFRLGDSAKEFSIRNDLVRLAMMSADPVLNESKAKRVLEGQLGVMLPMPTDDRLADAKRVLSRLDNNQKAVLAAVLPRLAVCDPNVSDAEFHAAIKKSGELVNQFWVGFDSYKPDPPPPEGSAEELAMNLDQPLNPPPPPVNTMGCDAVLLKYLVFDRVRETMLSHAYVTTFLYDSIQACRRVGKFSPTRFRWLKMLDRRLWLLVNSAGRATPFWEAAGTHAHYLWERKSGRASERPHVEEAVHALSEETAAILFTKDQKDRIWKMQGGVPVAPPQKGPGTMVGRKVPSRIK